jgi:hypothetical protein
VVCGSGAESYGDYGWKTAMLVVVCGNDVENGGGYARKAVCIDSLYLAGFFMGSELHLFEGWSDAGQSSCGHAKLPHAAQ